VTHVVRSTTEGAGFGQALAMQAVENRSFYPKWGVDAGRTSRPEDAPALLEVHARALVRDKAAGMTDALARVGGGWTDGNTIDGLTRLGSNRHDGAYLIRDLKYSAQHFDGVGAFCFLYTLSPRQM